MSTMSYIQFYHRLLMQEVVPSLWGKGEEVLWWCRGMHHTWFSTWLMWESFHEPSISICHCQAPALLHQSPYKAPGTPAHQKRTHRVLWVWGPSDTFFEHILQPSRRGGALWIEPGGNNAGTSCIKETTAVVLHWETNVWGRGCRWIVILGTTYKW